MIERIAVALLLLLSLEFRTQGWNLIKAMEFKLRITTSSVVVVVLCLFATSISTDTTGNEGQQPERAPSIFETTGRLFSLPTAFPACTDRWMKAKNLLNRLHPTRPPNLESKSDPECDNKQVHEDSGSGSGAGSAGKKVKEAAAKSLEKEKTAVEESARSTAQIVERTARKIKESLPGRGRAAHSQSQGEL